MILYRTVVTALLTVGMLLVGYWLGSRHGWTEVSARAFDSLCLWASVIAVGQAGKSAVEALAQGGGVKGAAAALLTQAKPGDTQPAPSPEPK